MPRIKKAGPTGSQDQNNDVFYSKIKLEEKMIKKIKTAFCTK